MNNTTRSLAFAGLMTAFALPFAGYQLLTGGEITATVSDKERVCSGSKDGNSDCKWIVMTDKMSFKNTDALFHLKFSSTDLQGKLKPGETYTFTYYGWRIPLISVYPNIVGAEVVK